MTSNNSITWGRKGNGVGETGEDEQKGGASLARDDIGQRREPHISGKEWITPNTTSRIFCPPKSSSSSSSPLAAVDVPPGFGVDRGSGHPLKVVEGERVRDIHRVCNEDDKDPVTLPAVEPETLLERERSLGAGSMTWAPSQRVESENKSRFPGKVDNAPRRGYGFGQLDSTGREVVLSEREFERRVDRYLGSREDLQRKSSAIALLNSGRDLSSTDNEMEGRIDRYASSREDSLRRSGTIPQLDTGRESTSAEKEMEGRVDRYASSRDSHSRESDHGIKTLPSSNFDWRKRDRSALAHASSRSPPFFSANTSSQDIGVRRQGAAFDISAGTPSPQVSPYSGASSIANEGGPDDASHLSPPKRPRLGWGQGLAKYEKKKVGDGDEASKSSSVTRGEAPPTAEPQSEEESPLDGVSISGSWGTPSSSAKGLLPEIAIGDNAPTVTEGIGPKLEPGSGHDIRPGNSLEKGGTTLPELTGPHLDSSSVKPTIQSGVSGAPQLSSSGFPDQVEAAHPSRYLRLTREVEAVSGAPTEISNDDEHSKPGGLVDDLSTWTKEAILMRVEKVEGEIDSLEKELAKVARETDGQSPKKVGCSPFDEGGHSHDVASPATENVALDYNGMDDPTSASSLPSLPSPSMVDAVMVECTDEKIVEQVTTLSPCAESPLSSATEQVNNEDLPPLKSPSACSGETDHCGEEEILKEITNDISAEAKRQLTVKDMQVKQITDVVCASEYEARSRMAYQWSLVYLLIQENRKVAKEAAAPFSSLLSKDALYDRPRFYSSPEDAPVWRENVESHVKNQERMQIRLAERRKLLRFKERVLALKYRALKEECQNGQIMLCPRRDRFKAVRRWEVDRRNAAAFALTNQRPTLRVRPVLATSRIDAAQEEHLKKRILAVIPANHLRQDLKMPSMIIDEKERSFRRFVNQNGLVEDPVSYEQERKSMNPWTAEEKKLFLEKFAVFTKNFNKIASFLEHKTTADCVEYYYRNQKSDDFERVRRRQQLKKRRDYSVAGASYLATTTPGNNRHHRDGNATRVQALTLAAYAASRDCSKTLRGSSHKSVDKARPDSVLLEHMLVKPGFVKESRAGSITDPTFSGCGPGSLNVGTTSASKNFREKLAVKTGSGFVSPSVKGVVLEQHYGSKGMRTTLIHHDPAKIDGEEVDSEWTDTERQRFIDAVIRFGKEFKSIAGHVGSKTQTQCKTYFSKTRKRFKLDELVEQSQENPHVDSGLGGVVMTTESTCHEKVENPGEFPTVEISGGEGQGSKVPVDQFKHDMTETTVADGLMLLGEALEPEIAALTSKLPDVSTMTSPVSTAAFLAPPQVSLVPSTVSLVPSTVSHSSSMAICTLSPVPSALSIVPSAVPDLASKVSDLLPLTSDFQPEGSLHSEVSDLPEKVHDVPSKVLASPAEVLHLPSKPSYGLSKVSDLLSMVADLPSNGSDFVPKDSDLPSNVSDMSSTKPVDTPLLTIATEEHEAGDAEILSDISTGSVLLNEQKHPEQAVKAEQVDNDSPVIADGLIKIQNGIAELSGMKPEPETLGKTTMEIRREYDKDGGQPARSLEKSSGVFVVAHPEDNNFSSVVVKAEPMVPLDAGGASLTSILPPTAQAVSLCVAVPPSHHSGQPRERGSRIAGGEFKPRREPTSWTQEEKEKFAEIIRRHGKDWSLLHENLPAKSLTQIKTYFQNSKAKLGFLPSDGLTNITARGGSTRKRKAEESDTSSNAGSTGQTPIPKVSMPSEDIPQKVISSSMMSMSTNIGTPIVSGDGLGYPHFNPSLVQSGEDSSSVRDIQRLMRRMVASTEYPSQSTIPSALIPLFQPGSFPTTNTQQPLLLGSQKQQVMVGHQPPQHPLPATQAILQQQQQQISQMTPTQRQLLTLKVVQQLHQQQLQQQQPQQQTQPQPPQQQQQQQQLPQSVVPQQLQHQLQQQVTQMVAASKQQQQQQQQQQHHLAQVVKHIQPQLLQHVQQAIPLATPAHPHQLGSRLKQAVSQQQPQVVHSSRVPHPSSQQQTFLQQQQFLQQQKHHLIQQLQQEHLSQQIQYQLQLTQKQIQQQPQLQQLQQLQQLHQLHQFQLQKEHVQQQIQQQIHQQQVQQQQVQKQQVQQQQQLQQSLGLFRTPYQSFFVDPDLLRQSEMMEQRSTASKLGLLPREDLQQAQSQRPAQVLPQQPLRTTSSSEPQQLRLGDVKLFGQSLLSQPPTNAGQASMASSQKQWEPVTATPTGPVNMLTSNISKVYGKDPSLVPSAFTRAGGSIRPGEGHSQARSAASSGNLDPWNSMVGGLQGVVVYKNDDAKSYLSSAQDAVARVTARLSREAHDKDGEDKNSLEHVDSGGAQDLKSKEVAGDIVRGKDVVEVSSEPGRDRARVECEWRKDSLQPMSSEPRGAQGGVSISEQGGFTEEILQQLVKGMAGSGPLGPHASALAQIFREAQSNSVQANLLSSMSKSSWVNNLGPRISESQVVLAGPSFQSGTVLRSHPGQEEESVPSDSKNPEAS